MPLNNPKVHPAFRWNGHQYSASDLRELGYSLIKEGDPYEKSIGDFLMDWFDGHETLQVGSSGSTGVPKKIWVAKTRMVHSAKMTGDFFGLVPGMRALLCLPADYIAGRMMLVRAMTLGLELDCIAPSGNPLGDTNSRYDFGAMVPLQVSNGLDRLDAIDVLIIGGASIPNKLQNALCGAGNRIYETYGMTESLSHVAVKQLAPFQEKVFRALPGVTFGTDNRGCLVIMAPQLTEDALVTNDMVELLSPTSFEWKGRYDNVINSGGIKLYPEQIEAKLGRVLSETFFVTSFPDARLGQRLVLVVEGTMDPDVIQTRLKEADNLNSYEVPKEVLSVHAFSRTPNGKIQRRKTLEKL